MLDRFSWRSYDLRNVLPAGWEADISKLADEAVKKVLRPLSVTSREGDPDIRIPVLTVNGQVIREQLRWLYDMYKGYFRDLAQLGMSEPVSTADNDIYGVVLNVQRGSAMRYECHVDSNPIEGLLYVTEHPPGTGGDLVVANRTAASSVEDVDADCSVVYPQRGNLLFFDARRFPHYVRPLTDPQGIRIAVAMNFYTPSCPESARPGDLTGHLFGYEQ